MFFQKLLYKNSVYTKIAILTVLMINTIFISFFMMVITGIDNITNDTLDQSKTIITYLSSLVFPCSLAVFFFQWIIFMLYGEMIEARNDFNSILRKMGVSIKNIYKIYWTEFVVLQIVAQPIAIIGAFNFYNVMMQYYGYDSTMEGTGVILGITSTLVTSLITLRMVLNKNIVTFDNVGHATKSKVTKFAFISNHTKQIKLISAIILFGSSIYNLMNNNVDIFLLFTVINILIFWGEILENIISSVCKILPDKFNITLLILKGFSRKIRVISYTMILGLTLVLGLNAFIQTTRNHAYNSVMENINYNYVITHELLTNKEIDNIFNTKHISALSFRENENKIGSSTLTMLGVEKNYFQEYENIELMYGDQDFIFENWDNPEYNGIILCEHLINEDNIGQSIELTVDGKLVSFEIVGGSSVNDFSKMSGYVSKGFIQQILNQGDVSNITFLKEYNNSLENNYTVETKQEIANKSYTKAVQGTFILEITAIIVLLSSFFMLANFIIITAKKSNVDIARMRAMGMPGHNINSIYILTYMLIIIASVPLAALSAYVGGKNFMVLMLGLPNIKLDFNWALFGGYILAYLVFLVMVYYTLAQKTIKEYIYVLKSKSI
ncbi:MAG: hypothetical protein ATN36_07495 [Epulopiscium sp. Nele67-Bin005]|nr:MAG: hypothetical protein ATN36_07495 [Epulopiscium sp. Nele67-Bin005]